MKIVLVGVGEVGYYLAKKLIQENHDLYLIDVDPEKVKRASETLDAIVVQGSGSSQGVLEKVGVREADILVAASSVDEVNIVSCLIGKELGVKNVVARVRRREYIEKDSVLLREKYGIDLIVHPEKAASEEIIRLIQYPSASKIVDFGGGKLLVAAVKLGKRSKIVNKTLREVTQEVNNVFLCLCIERNGGTIIPRGDDRYMEGDTVYLITNAKSLKLVLKSIVPGFREQQNIMIYGASNIGKMVAEVLSEDLNVKLIEGNRDEAVHASEELRDTLILQGKGTDIDLLLSEQVEHMDSFVAVSDNEETNLLSALLAKYLGVKRTLIHVNTNEYVPIINKLGVDAVVSKHLSTVNAIMKFIRRGRIISVSLFEGIDAEAIELVPKRGSYITRKPLKDLALPRNIIIGAILRNNEVIIPRGDTVVEPDDNVVVFARPEHIKKVEKFFN
ncbi:MAG: Trk system potassium transporter TrkA [Candidatus Neomarinimicrobiota bacterium]|nr:Trk system potassium transporter TrkA [Candidatus Neomarinimicrobiota bacterium]MCD6100425.1 Trk system potassium transporter TrkA [Candidatus Neomarinimicrobiota bacterium]RKY49544.1 MAG: Trk system potassium transporter TrkA [Candidatus Neomarinimicrobiota bacterium]RKY53409.1 MAG: Trk system potassium transporter TrkA [Candidatus Neomarinimicrobiota bacterium]